MVKGENEDLPEARGAQSKSGGWEGESDKRLPRGSFPYLKAVVRRLALDSSQQLISCLFGKTSGPARAAANALVTTTTTLLSLAVREPEETKPISDQGEFAFAQIRRPLAGLRRSTYNLNRYTSDLRVTTGLETGVEKMPNQQ